jgi:hypothetical protein
MVINEDDHHTRTLGHVCLYWHRNVRERDERLSIEKNDAEILLNLTPNEVRRFHAALGALLADAEG